MVDHALFFVSCFAFAFVPGPAMLYTVSKTLSEGKHAGFRVVFGIFLGSQVHVFIAAIGAAALLMTYPNLFLLLRYVGGCYFLYLGVQKIYPLLFSSVTNDYKVENKPSSLKESFIVEILNPKSSLFYLAFTPQFLSSDTNNPMLSLLLIGTLANFIMSLGDFIIVLVTSIMKNTTFKSKTYETEGTLLAGIIFLILGCSVFIETIF
jgi:threonine/homoserine/homoserine lactone efflux protein